MIKNNIDRKNKFQLTTFLDKNNNIIYKKSEKKESLEFLKSLNRKYTKISNYDKNINFNKILKLENNKIFFEYIEGKSIEEAIMEDLSNKNVISFLNKYIEVINLFTTCKISEKDKKKSENIFGISINYLNKNDLYLKSGLLDIIPSNIILDKSNNIHIIDYEWVFDFPINKKYIIWRGIFFMLYKISLNKNSLKLRLIYKKFIKKMNIGLFEEFCFINMEYNFQKYVNKTMIGFIKYLRGTYIIKMLRFTNLLKK